MRAFMKRSILLMQEHASGGAFRTEPLGYLFASRRPSAATAFEAEARACHGDDVRVFSSAASVTAAGRARFGARTALATGADVDSGEAAVIAGFPYLSSDVTGLMHTRNCGWLVSAHTMGMDMLDSLLARRGADGASLTTLIHGAVVGADLGPSGARVKSIKVRQTAANSPPLELSCGSFINATGPFLRSTHADILGARDTKGAAARANGLPTVSEVHAKVIFRDVLGLIPRDAPQVILTDAIAPVWLPGELDFLAETEGAATAARAGAIMSGGAHFRPYGGEKSNAVLMLWESWHHGVEAGRGDDAPPESANRFLETKLYPDICLRGLARVIPALAAYFDEDARDRLSESRGGSELPHPVEPITDGGYYTKTKENHPLVGPAPGPAGEGKLDGAFLCGAVSGYGIMASHAAGELAAAHAVGGALPTHMLSYADLLNPLRYQDKEFVRPGGVRDQLLAAGGGQL